MSHDTPILRPPTLMDQAYGQIKSRLIKGILDGGMSIPTLAKELGVSRTPVREAILRLAREGFIEILPNKGFVAKPLKEETIREIFLIRKALESLVVEQLISRMTQDQLAVLVFNLENQRKSAPGLRGWNSFVEKDKEFHCMLAKFAGLDNTQEIIANLWDLMLTTKTSNQFVTRRDSILSEHEKILTALKRRDTKASLKAIALHLDSSEHYLRSCVGFATRAAMSELRQ